MVYNRLLMFIVLNENWIIDMVYVNYDDSWINNVNNHILSAILKNYLLLYS